MKKKQNEANPSAIEALLGNGKKISRREFMARSAALGASLTLASSLLTSAVHASTPKRGGKVTIAMEDVSGALSYVPTRMATGTDAQRSYQV